VPLRIRTLHEVWFDGAHPKRRVGRTYNYLAWKEINQQLLAPKAVIWERIFVGCVMNLEWN